MRTTKKDLEHRLRIIRRYIPANVALDIAYTGCSRYTHKIVIIHPDTSESELSSRLTTAECLEFLNGMIAAIDQLNAQPISQDTGPQYSDDILSGAHYGEYKSANDVNT